jgi:CBS domain containing-hemolysin-like protein
MIGKTGEQFGRAAEQTGGGAEAASVRAVVRLFVVEAQVDKAAGELDECFVVGVERSGGFEPEVFEHVMRCVILGGVEEPEILHVGGFPATGVAGVEGGQAGGDFFVFAHGVGKKQRRAAMNRQKAGWRWTRGWIKWAFCMTGHWLIWLFSGLVLASAGAFLTALEAVVWQTPRDRMDRWPKSPGLQLRAGDFAHPRDCLFSFLMLGGGMARAAGWWALWVAGVQAAKVFPGTAWLWVPVFMGPVVLLEVLPAMVTARRPRAWEYPLLRAGAVVLRLFGPLFDRVQPLVASLARRLFPWSVEPRPPLGAEEAETLVWVREEEGAFTMAEAETLAEVLRLSRATVRAYMTPRVDVVFIEDGMTNEEVRDVLQRRRFLRAPVIGETPDEVVGLLDTRALSRLPEGMHFTEVLLPPSFVPETMEASQLLKNFLQHRQPLAVVLDEFGGVEGVVTLEDFLEEILGDAAPRVEPDLYIEQLGDGRLLATGTARLDDLSDYLEFDARREGIETIGGYIINQLGKLPRTGAHVKLGPWRVTVKAMGQRRVREVVLQRTPSRAEVEA